MEHEDDLVSGLAPVPARLEDREDARNIALAAENARLRQDAERLARRLASRYEETVGLRTQIEWMRPVVEAAEAHRFHVFLETVDRECSDEEMALFDAVDAYRAGQKAPDRVDPTDLAIPDLTDEERRAFVAAASEGPDPCECAWWREWLRERADRIGGATDGT